MSVEAQVFILTFYKKEELRNASRSPELFKNYFKQSILGVTNIRSPSTLCKRNLFLWPKVLPVGCRKTLNLKLENYLHLKTLQQKRKAIAMSEVFWKLWFFFRFFQRCLPMKQDFRRYKVNCNQDICFKCKSYRGKSKRIFMYLSGKRCKLSEAELKLWPR